MLKLVQEGTVYIISWNRKHSAEITVIIMNVKGKFREKYINLYNIVLSFDVIKQNQSEVGNIDFKIEPNKVEFIFCFLLLLASFNCSYLWNQLTNFNGVFCKM